MHMEAEDHSLLGRICQPQLYPSIREFLCLCNNSIT